MIDIVTQPDDGNVEGSENFFFKTDHVPSKGDLIFRRNKCFKVIRVMWDIGNQDTLAHARLFLKETSE